MSWLPSPEFYPKTRLTDVALEYADTWKTAGGVSGGLAFRSIRSGGVCLVAVSEAMREVLAATLAGVNTAGWLIGRKPVKCIKANMGYHLRLASQHVAFAVAALVTGFFSDLTEVKNKIYGEKGAKWIPRIMLAGVAIAGAALAAHTYGISLLTAPKAVSSMMPTLPSRFSFLTQMDYRIVPGLLVGGLVMVYCRSKKAAPPAKQPDQDPDPLLEVPGKPKATPPTQPPAHLKLINSLFFLSSTEQGDTLIAAFSSRETHQRYELHSMATYVGNQRTLVLKPIVYSFSSAPAPEQIDLTKEDAQALFDSDTCQIKFGFPQFARDKIENIINNYFVPQPQ